MSPEEAALFQYDAEFADMLRAVSGKEDLTQVTLYKGTGCKHCGQTGYVDRVGIFEVMEVDEEIRTLIVAKAAAEEIRESAIARGMTTMLYDGMTKVVKGTTSLSEVIRAIKI
jgi:type II secretory ATPase GspE/PulE/Tfp pilus assembly ATPase PilB-like protein